MNILTITTRSYTYAKRVLFHVLVFLFILLSAKSRLRADGWQAWQQEDPATAQDLRAIHIINSNNIWAVGGRPGAGRIIHFNGQGWEAPWLGGEGWEGEEALYGIWMVSEQEEWPICEAGTLVPPVEIPGTGKPRRMTPQK